MTLSIRIGRDQQAEDRRGREHGDNRPKANKAAPAWIR
jgi:hypothetical protein